MTALLGSRGTGQAGQPTWWASWAVRSASLPLPSEHRWRYRQEFLAELYGMTPAEQRHHATGVLSRVWTLRAALNEAARLMPRRPPWPSPGFVESEGTAGSASVTLKAAGTTNASNAEHRTTSPTGALPIPSGLERPMRLATTPVPVPAEGT